MKYRDIKRALEQGGYVIVRANKHWVFSNGQYSITVPRKKDIGESLAINILKQMRINNENRERK